MFRLILTSRRAFLLIALIEVLSILGCASTQFVPDADTEKWIGKISGMAKGDLELYIKQTQGQSNFYSVTGPFVMKLETTGGYIMKVLVTYFSQTGNTEKNRQGHLRGSSPGQ